MPKKTNPYDLNSNINLFLRELPDAKTTMQSVYSKELSFGEKKVVLVAQQIKGANGMTWNINVC
ncbi:hypothetical protein [Desertivirga brevis]|uniref:hypothetical protein n=1 Tax=Desertivirga brevis TaxID=2810310 RepID=UPI001A95B198|nr:hypothetical protein [Pedobacter sp. SYSU D00873]